VHFLASLDGVRTRRTGGGRGDRLVQGGRCRYYHSYLIVAPDERLAVPVFLPRLGYGNHRWRPGRRILLDALAERGSITSVPAPLEPAALSAIPVSDEDLAAIAGLYAGSYGPRRLEVQDDRP